jgi:hypothetical protein
MCCKNKNNSLQLFRDCLFLQELLWALTHHQAEQIKASKRMSDMHLFFKAISNAGPGYYVCFIFKDI